MAYDQKRAERLARAMASDTIVYNKDAILKSFEEDNFFEVLKDNMEDNRKSLKARMGDEAANSNVLERSVCDNIFFTLGQQGKYPIF